MVWRKAGSTIPRPITGSQQFSKLRQQPRQVHLPNLFCGLLCSRLTRRLWLSRSFLLFNYFLNNGLDHDFRFFNRNFFLCYDFDHSGNYCLNNSRFFFNSRHNLSLASSVFKQSRDGITLDTLVSRDQIFELTNNHSSERIAVSFCHVRTKLYETIHCRLELCLSFHILFLKSVEDPERIERYSLAGTLRFPGGPEHQLQFSSPYNSLFISY